MCIEFEKMMHKKFQMSFMGEFTFFLGLQVKQKEDRIFISQDKYVNEILNKFGFSDVKTASTPMETHKTLLKDEKEEDCKKQTMVANSTTEAEYVAALSCCGQVLWIQNQLMDYGYTFMQTKIHTNNKSTICIVKNPVFHSKTKHIKIRHHFIRYSNEKKLIQMIKIHTDKNVLDFLTKAFDPTKSAGFEKIIDFLNAHPIKYALTVNLTIYTSCVEQFWATTKVKNINGEAQLHAKVDGEKETIIDEAVNEEMYDSLERATTTASGLDVEQGWGNITKTQSMATPNEPSSPGTSSGGGTRRQDTMGDTIAQTRSENVSNFSNDPPLSRVNTLGSREDILKLKELMELCIKLFDRVLNLEKTKTTQANEIANLKKRVKRLERKKKSRSHGLKRLYKERIFDIDANQDIYLVSIHRDEDIFGVNDQDDTSMFDADKDLQGEEVVDEVNAASITTHVSAAATTTTTATTPTISMDEIILAKTLTEIKTSRPKGKEKIDADYQLVERLHVEEQEQFTDVEKAKLFMEFIEKRKKFFAAKRDEERRKKPLTKAQQRSIMTTYLKNMDGWKPRALKNKSFAEIKELFDKAMERINSFVDFRTELVEESAKKSETKIAQESSSKRAGDELE
nr:putative ribonuclease H-like domain-containing protein [Tanacetum cinerariifolium]